MQCIYFWYEWFTLVCCLLFFLTTVCFYFRLKYSPLSLVLLIPRSIPVGFQYCQFFYSSFLSFFCLLLLHFLPSHFFSPFPIYILWCVFHPSFPPFYFLFLLSSVLFFISFLLPSTLLSSSPLLCSIFHIISPPFYSPLSLTSALLSISYYFSSALYFIDRKSVV